MLPLGILPQLEVLDLCSCKQTHLFSPNNSEIAIESGDKSRPGRKRKAGTAPGKMRVTDSKTPRYVLDLL